MVKRYIGYGLLALGLVVTANAEAPQSGAAPGTCEHRGYHHVDHHGGKKWDDAYHLSRGQRVSCDGEDEPALDPRPWDERIEEIKAWQQHGDNKDKSDDGGLPHRDKLGKGCKPGRGCG